MTSGGRWVVEVDDMVGVGGVNALRGGGCGRALVVVVKSEAEL